MARIVAIDANLLVLLIVGLADESYIEKHKRLRAYSINDFVLLKRIISNYEEAIVTPNVLTEASNLIVQIEEPARSNIAAAFKAFIEATTEVYVTSRDASVRDEFVRLGLADAGMLQLAKREMLILTSDLELYLAAAYAGYEAANFNHAIEASQV